MGKRKTKKSNLNYIQQCNAYVNGLIQRRNRGLAENKAGKGKGGKNRNNNNNPNKKNDLFFNNLVQLQKITGDKEKLTRLIKNSFLGNENKCPYDGCDCTDIWHYKNNKTHKCTSCKKQFNIFTNTIFADSKIALPTWIDAIYYVITSACTVESLRSHIGVSVKTAYNMMEKICLICLDQSIWDMGLDEGQDADTAEYEMDTTSCDGKNQNRHDSDKASTKNENGKTYSKGGPEYQEFLTIVKRNGKARVFAIPNVQAESMIPYILKCVPLGANLYTDGASTFTNVGKLYLHQIVIHSDGEYVRNNVYTNTAEGLHSLIQHDMDIHNNNISKEKKILSVNRTVFDYNTRKESLYKKIELALTNAATIKYIKVKRVKKAKQAIIKKHDFLKGVYSRIAA